MPGGKRLWRTESGGLVEDGHKDAVLLAYGIDDDLSPEDAKTYKGKHTLKPAADATAKDKGTGKDDEPEKPAAPPTAKKTTAPRRPRAKKAAETPPAESK